MCKTGVRKGQHPLPKKEVGHAKGLVFFQLGRATDQPKGEKRLFTAEGEGDHVYGNRLVVPEALRGVIVSSWCFFVRAGQALPISRKNRVSWPCSFPSRWARLEKKNEAPPPSRRMKTPRILEKGENFPSLLLRRKVRRKERTSKEQKQTEREGGVF